MKLLLFLLFSSCFILIIIVDVEVYWGDPALKRWLNSKTRNTTKYGYKTAFKAYTLFTGKTASALIDEALEDAKKEPRQSK